MPHLTPTEPKLIIRWAPTKINSAPRDARIGCCVNHIRLVVTGIITTTGKDYLWDVLVLDQKNSASGLFTPKVSIFTPLANHTVYMGKFSKNNSERGKSIEFQNQIFVSFFSAVVVKKCNEVCILGGCNVSFVWWSHRKNHGRVHFLQLHNSWYSSSISNR
jgi:hypothetical protein